MADSGLESPAMSGEQLGRVAARGFDPEAEQDVDLRRYLGLLFRRWWVIAVGFVLGAVVGFAIVVGHGQTYQATATIYLGLPYGSGGDVPLQSAQTNPSTLGQIVHSFAVDGRVARACRTPVGSFSHGISTQEVSGTSAKNRQNAFVTLSVLARQAKIDRCAANGLAREVVLLLAPYAKGKIAAYHAQISNDDQTIKLVAAAMKSKRSSPVDRIVLTTRLSAAQTDKIHIAGLLAQTIQVEKPLQIGHARAVRVTARTSKSSALVAGLIGLILGVLGVLFWDARARRDANDSVAPKPV